MATVLIKWVGDPVLVAPDGFSVPDWEYETRRVQVVPSVNGRSGTYRRLGRKDGLSRTYEWAIDTPDMTIRMYVEDWQILHEKHPHEFKDVTHVADRSAVRNDVFTVPVGSVGIRPPGIIKP